MEGKYQYTKRKIGRPTTIGPNKIGHFRLPLYLFDALERIAADKSSETGRPVNVCEIVRTYLADACKESYPRRYSTGEHGGENE